MLHINNACIAFGTEVLFSGFEMKLEKGETACIVGQSGCGKTSLLNAVMGFVPLKEGSIQVGEILLDISTIDSVRRQIAWIPQELALPFENFTKSIKKQGHTYQNPFVFLEIFLERHVLSSRDIIFALDNLN